MPDRIRAYLGADAAGLPEPLDERNPLHVDKAAERLIKRFYADNDGDAFELLVEVTLPLLNGAAEDVAREAGVAAGAHTLLTGIFSNLFTSPRRPVGLQDAAFLQWTVGEIRKVAAAHVERLAARKIPVAETLDADVNESASRRAQSAHGGGILGRLAMAVATTNTAELEAVGLSMSTVVEIVFHRLSVDDRRVLRCVEVARMNDDAVATLLQLPVDEIQARNAKARGELQAGVHAALEAISDKLSCALDGNALKAVSSEQLAGHLVTCEKCSGTADLMHSLGDVGGWLASVQSSPGQPTLVEQVLAGVSAQGKDELARVLYEMRRALMAEMDEARSTITVEDPAPIDTLVASAREMASRSGDARLDLVLGDPASAAERVVRLLEAVEPGQFRARWSRAKLSFHHGDLAAALAGFDAIAGDSGETAERCAHARVSMMHCLLRLCRYDEVLVVAERHLNLGVMPKWAAIYRVWVSAWTHDAQMFADASELFRASADDGATEAWWVELVLAEAAWIADRLNLTIEAVRSALGGPN